MAKKATNKPVQSKSKVTLARENLVTNVASKSQAQVEKEQRQLKAAKREAAAQAAYDKELTLQMVALAKMRAREDAQRAAMGLTKPLKRNKR